MAATIPDIALSPEAREVLKRVPTPLSSTTSGTYSCPADVAIILKRGGLMIRAILKKGKIQPVVELPGQWRDGQELMVEGGEPSNDPSDIKKWHEKLVA